MKPREVREQRGRRKQGERAGTESTFLIPGAQSEKPYSFTAGALSESEAQRGKGARDN